MFLLRSPAVVSFLQSVRSYVMHDTSLSTRPKKRKYKKVDSAAGGSREEADLTDDEEDAEMLLSLHDITLRGLPHCRGISVANAS